jgi:hypothetical protein
MKLETICPLNEHRVDRTLRVLVGIALLALVFVGPQTPWGLLGLLPLVTGLIGSCPLYTVLRISTRDGGRKAREGGMPGCCGGA